MKKRIADAWNLRHTGRPDKPFAFEKVESAAQAMPFNRVASTWWALHLAGKTPIIHRKSY